jgi:hypothetical protein
MKRALDVVALAHPAVLLAGLLLATPAGAQEVGLLDREVPAPRGALEIGLGAGYVQGAGRIGESQAAVQDVAGPGAMAEIHLGYRATPRLAIGAYGSYSRSRAGMLLPAGSDVIGVTAGLYAEWHVRPSRAVDQWIGVASGLRGLWLVPTVGKRTTYKGWELFQLQLGLDIRFTPAISVGPVIGASVNMFLTQDGPQTGAYQKVSDPGASVFVFGGLRARFDLLGSQ